MERQELIKKIEKLPPNRLAEVENFVELLTLRDNEPDQRNLHQAITAYAIEHAGTSIDLDDPLESAAVEHLLKEDSPQ